MCRLSLEHWCPKRSRIKTWRTYHPCLQGITSHLCWIVAQRRVRTRVFCCVNTNKIPFWGVKHEMGLQSALKSSSLPDNKDYKASCWETSLLYNGSWFNTVFHKLPANWTELILHISSKVCVRGWTLISGRRGGVTGAAGYCPITPPSGLRYQNEKFCLYILSW